MEERLDVAETHVQSLSGQGVDGMRRIPYEHRTRPSAIPDVLVRMVES